MHFVSELIERLITLVMRCFERVVHYVFFLKIPAVSALIICHPSNGWLIVSQETVGVSSMLDTVVSDLDSADPKAVCISGCNA